MPNEVISSNIKDYTAFDRAGIENKRKAIEIELFSKGAGGMTYNKSLDNLSEEDKKIVVEETLKILNSLILRKSSLFDDLKKIEEQEYREEYNRAEQQSKQKKEKEDEEERLFKEALYVASNAAMAAQEIERPRNPGAMDSILGEIFDLVDKYENERKRRSDSFEISKNNLLNILDQAGVIVDDNAVIKNGVDTRKTATTEYVLELKNAADIVEDSGNNKYSAADIDNAKKVLAEHQKPTFTHSEILKEVLNDPKVAKELADSLGIDVKDIHKVQVKDGVANVPGGKLSGIPVSELQIRLKKVIKDDNIDKPISTINLNDPKMLKIKLDEAAKKEELLNAKKEQLSVGKRLLEAEKNKDNEADISSTDKENKDKEKALMLYEVKLQAEEESLNKDPNLQRHRLLQEIIMQARTFVNIDELVEVSNIQQVRREATELVEKAKLSGIEIESVDRSKLLRRVADKDKRDFSAPRISKEEYLREKEEEKSISHEEKIIKQRDKQNGSSKSV